MMKNVGEKEGIYEYATVNCHPRMSLGLKEEDQSDPFNCQLLYQSIVAKTIVYQCRSMYTATRADTIEKQ